MIRRLRYDQALTNVVQIVLSSSSSFFLCLPACLRKIDKLFNGITAMTEAVFSDVGPRKLSSRSCADGVSMLSKMRTFLSALPEEDDAHVPVSGCDRRNLWRHSFQFWSSHHDQRHCFARNRHCFIFPTAPRQLLAGRERHRRRDQVRLGRTENTSKSQLPHFFENDNKWIRL